MNETSTTQSAREMAQHETAFAELIRAFLVDATKAKIGVLSGRANDLLHKLNHLEELRTTAATVSRDREATELLFNYINYRGEPSHRRVRPISIRFGASEYHAKPKWLMLAVDLAKNEEREFAMDDMSNVVPDKALALATPVVSRDREAPNGCIAQTIAALKYLAENDRPVGGQSRFNSEHLYQLADELKSTPAAGYEAGEMREALGQICAFHQTTRSFGYARDNEVIDRFLAAATAALAALPVQGTQSSDSVAQRIEHPDPDDGTEDVGLTPIAVAPSEAIPVTDEVQDIRWAVNVLLETIAKKFEDNDTMDLWRSDAASTVRSFKHDLSKVAPSPLQARVQHLELGYEAIREGLRTGKITGSDVIWYSMIETLFDFCGHVLTGSEPPEFDELKPLVEQLAEAQARALAAERCSRVDQALAKQLAELIQANEKLTAEIAKMRALI